MPDPITSPKNPRIRELVRLRDRRTRDRTGRFVIEGFRELSRALEGGVAIETVFACPELYLGANEPTLVESLERRGAEVVRLGEDAFRRASYRDRPEGLLAVAPHLPVDLGRIPSVADPLVLVVEAIEKPGNLGTMLRTADAAGAAGVVVCDPTTDPFNPNVVRASIGVLFLLPLAVAGSDETVAWCRERGMRTVATTPATSRAHWEADLTGPTAIVVGSEQYGLSDHWLGEADERVRIPMQGRTDSLNAAMAAGVVLFEAVRQRAAAEHQRP